MDITSINPTSYLVSHTLATSPQDMAERRALIQAAKSVKASGRFGRNELVFAIDRATRRPIIRVEDRETHEVVLQLPAQYVLELAQDLGATSSHTIGSQADM